MSAVPSHPSAGLPPLASLADDRTAVSIRDAFGAAMLELGRDDPRVVVLDGDLANSTKVDAFADAFPDRFFEMGIAEQNMIGVAAGLATTGLVPFATTFAAFAAFRDLDQVRVAVAQTKLHVVVVGTYSGLMVGRPGKSHVCLEDLALMRVLPNMTVLAPGDAVEARLAVRLAAAHDGPVYLRLIRGPSATVFAPGHALEVGRAVLVRDGADVALLSTGMQLGRTVEAADLLAADGIDTLVLHVPTVKPLDVAAIVEAARRTGAVVTTEDHSIVGGFGSAVAEVLAEHLPTPLRRVGTRDVWIESAPDEELLARHRLTAPHVADAVRELLAARAGRRPSREGREAMP